MKGTLRVLILTADAGLGHRSAAEAIDRALNQRYGADCEIKIVNPLADERVPDFLCGLQSDYDQIVCELPKLYRLGYEIADAAVPAAILQRVIGGAIAEPVSDILKDFDAHIVVSTFPSYQGLLDTDWSERPYVTVITDRATIHQAWFHPDIDLCVVPTEAGRELALAAGVPADHIAVIGIPVDPALAESRDRVSLRAELGWQPDLTTLLAVGGERVTNLMQALRVVNHAGFPVQLALIAGSNDALYRQFQETEWHVPAHIYGFVDNMPELMHASDAILCKAGGLIVSEALAAGLPLLLVNALPGQETGNAESVVDGGAGALVQAPLEVLETLAHWLLDDGAGLVEAAQNARRLGNPRAAAEIAERIAALAPS
jgi:1,2-diacylglycerol 3-beta-galactosyltransferase